MPSDSQNNTYRNYFLEEYFQTSLGLHNCPKQSGNPKENNINGLVSYMDEKGDEASEVPIRQRSSRS